MDCLSLETFEDLLAGALDPPSAAAARAHLGACGRCADTFSEVADDNRFAASWARTGAEAAASAAPRVDGYRVESELRRGGQGIVWLATHEGTRRRVAIKVLLHGALAGEEERRRLLRELEAASALRHPHVVTVHDGGLTAEGLPFLAMELVDGEPLDRWLERAAPPLGRRLDVFAKIGAALAHAHRRGVIHRDLKPSNVLVGPDGEPKVLDFGLARLVGPAAAEGSLTADDRFVGTLAWAAPEQLAAGGASADTRTDVHGLGLLLFQLLAGRAPRTSGADLRALVREIEDAPAPRPSSIDRSLDRDLDAIVLRALAKEPDRRYPTVDELLRDLERHRRHEPVEARRSEIGYVLRKALRRHRVAVAAAFVVAASLVTATAVSVSAARDASRERARAEAAAAKSQEIVDFLRSAFRAASPAGLGADARFADVLRAALAELDRALPRSVEAEAILRATLGSTLAQLGFGAEALPALARAEALARQAFGGEAPQVAAIRESRALALAASGEEDAAREILERLHAAPAARDAPGRASVALSLAGLVVGSDPARALELALPIARRDKNGDFSADEAKAEYVIAHALAGLGRLDEAEARIASARARLEALPEFPRSWKVELALAHATVLILLQRNADAVGVARPALALAESVFPPDHPDISRARHAFALAAARLGLDAEAKAAFAALLESDARRPYRATEHLRHAALYLREMARHDGSAEVERWARALVRVESRERAKDPAPWVDAKIVLFQLLADDGRAEDAVEEARAAAAELEAERGAADAGVLRLKETLVRLLRRAGS